MTTPGGEDRAADYSDEPPVDSRRLSVPETVPYDPEPRRETVRLILAGALVALVVIEVLAGFIALMVGTSIDDLRVLLQIVFSPSVALAASATGFYFAGYR